MSIFLLVAAGYLIGSIPWGYVVSKLLRGVDIRTVGSGNLGAANVWRALGFKAGLAVALLDVGKGFAAALLGLWAGDELTGLLAGIAALVGHWRPLFMGLGRGGKIVATTGGVALALAPLACIAAGAIWVVSFLATRYTSVASLLSALALPLFALVFGSSAPVVGFSAGAALAILLLHRANIARLLSGTENRFKLSRRAGQLGPRAERGR
ncbi:MAG TPA: glycerol-3-phosphate 1-O-acyltransferase PlsY [Gaiellaceae bacterium]|jgi:glycerol-3-phosphate acyltransferase PlsY|nr:glycerol-3-phosphate 1-O-acyltransferase PlsY [Gaiellaceae bacterium]